MVVALTGVPDFDNTTDNVTLTKNDCDGPFLSTKGPVVLQGHGPIRCAPR